MLEVLSIINAAVRMDSAVRRQDTVALDGKSYFVVL